jgi:HEAT repeat protein
MSERRQARRWIAGILGGAAIVAAVGLGLMPRPRGAATAPVNRGAASPLAAINQGLRDSDPGALEAVQNRAAPTSAEARKALSDQDAAQWLETLSCLRTGFLKFSPPARATAAVVACQILNKFTTEPAPAHWIDVLPPVHDILSACLADADSNVRFIALGEVSRLWVWVPGRSLIEAEENELGNWKESLHRPVLRCLASTDVRTRIGAISCLGYLPIESAAAPALPYLEDNESVDVRRQALVSFSSRPRLLTEDMLLRRLHDSDPSIRETSALILKARGLNQELISLGGLMVSPKPQQRASVINLIKDRTDIDPIVWLLQLSHDADETVRVQSVAALGAQKVRPVSVKRRLAEMARSDTSEQVRQTAGKFVPSIDETTASLPPLPGSPSLNPKAN